MTVDVLPLVYLAGPYTSNPLANTRAAVAAAERIEAFGVAVVIPHLSLLWDLLAPAPVERWYERDLHVLARCDALVRLPGDSVGADAEVAFALGRGIAVFDEPTHSNHPLAIWVRCWRSVAA
jgi:nucleoside 2-deoxyribosyltransferase